MSKIIKIGDQYFKVDGLKLVETEAPETDADVFNGDEVASSINGAETLAQAYEQVGELKTAYTAAASKAAESGSTEDGAARVEASWPMLVAAHAYSARHTVVVEASQSIEEPPEPPKNSENQKADPKPAPTADAKNKENNNSGGGQSKTDGQTNDNTTPEDPLTGIVIPDDLSGLEEGERAVVQAAATLLQQPGVIDRVSGHAPAVGGMQVMQNGEVFDPSKVTELGGLPREQARFRTAAGLGTAEMGTRLSPREADEIVANAIRTLENSSGAAHRQILGSWELYGDNPNHVAKADGVNRLIQGRRYETVTAAGELCDHHDRRELPDCHDLTGDLTGLVEVVTTQNKCQLRYLKDLGLGSVADGVQVWDDTSKQALYDAREAYRAALIANDESAISAALAQINNAQKRCIETGCLEWSDFVTMVSIYSCIEWSIEQAQCSSEHISRHRRLLQKLFLRVKNSHFLANLAAHAVTVNVNAQEPPFVAYNPYATNPLSPADATEMIQLDASIVFERAITELMPQGLMAERLTGGNYTAIVPHGLTMALTQGNNQAAQNLQNEIKLATGVSRVITTLDTPATSTDIAPSGPYPTIPPAGTVVDFSTLRLPTDWSVLLVDLDDYFAISRPDIDVGAEVTHESAKQNFVAAEFFESHIGFGKDGCHPAWVLNFQNLCYNGVRVAPALPRGC